MAHDLDAILTHIEQLRQLDTSDVEPMTHAVPFDCPTARRPGRARCCRWTRRCENAPRRDGTFFEVPRVVPDAASGRDRHGEGDGS